VNPRAVFLLRALRRTQRLMDPGHYLAEYDLSSADEPFERSRMAAGFTRTPTPAG
jgi:hypothetical protein